jgi:hypothetical protein
VGVRSGIVRAWRSVCIVGVAVGAALALSACSGGAALPFTVTGHPVFGTFTGASCSLNGTTVTAAGTFYASTPSLLAVHLNVLDTQGNVIGYSGADGKKVWQTGTTWDWTVSASVGSATPTSCEIEPGGAPIGALPGIGGT